MVRVRSKTVSKPEWNLHTFAFLMLLLPVIPYFFKLIQFSRFFIFDFGGSRDQGYYVSRALAIWLDKSPSFVAGFPYAEDNRQGRVSNLLNFMSGNIFNYDLKVFAVAFYLQLLFFIFLLVKLMIDFFRLLNHRVEMIAIYCVFFLFFPAIFDGRKISILETNLYLRWPAPIIHYSLVFLVLIILFRSVHLKYIKSALVFSYSVYFYFYTWQIIGSIIFVHFCYDLLRRQRIYWKDFCFSLVLIISSLIPYLLRLYTLRKNLDPIDYKFLEVTNRLELSRSPSVTISLIILLFSFFLAIYMKLPEICVRTTFILFSVSAIVLNQNIVTGYEIQPGHFHWYFVYPMTFFVISLIISEWMCRFLSKKHLMIKFTSIFLVLIVLAFQIRSTIVAFKAVSNIDDYRQIQLADLENIRGRYLTFDSDISYFLDTSSHLNPYYDQDYGIMYPPNLERLVNFAIMSAQFENLEKNIVFPEYLLQCSSLNETVCVGIDATLKAYQGLFGTKNGEELFTQILQDRIDSFQNLSLAGQMTEQNIQYFITGEDLDLVQMRKFGITLVFSLGDMNHKLFFYKPNN